MRAWPKVALGELLRHASEPVRVQQDADYPNFGIYSFGRGLFAKPPISGMQTSAGTLYRVRAGNFIYSRLFAFEGSYGLVNDAFDGHFTSNEYLSFSLDRSRLEPGFLKAYFQFPRVWQDIAMGSKGVGSRRIRVQPDKVLAHRIPLPPLAEQQAIVARLDALAEKTREVESHLDAIERDSLRLLVTLATRRDLTDEQRRALGWRPGTIADIAALALHSEPVETDRSYSNVGILSYARGVFGKVPIDGAATSAKTLYRIRSGQFIYSRLFAFEGAYALVPDEFDGCFVSNEFPTFDVDPDLASSKFLMVLFMTEADWHEMRASTKGVGDRRLRIQPEHILARQIWIPPPRDVSLIDSMFDHLIALKAKHAAIRQANAALIRMALT
jgi:type I restriction enzyme S subunit